MSAGNPTRIAFIGFGEAGGVLGAALVAAGAEVCMYDLLLDDPAQRDVMRRKAEAAGVQVAVDLADALASAELVFSTVTASSARQAAHDAGRWMRDGQTYLDLNSVSGATKRADRDGIEASGAAYVEAAVMAPVPPYGIGVPMLLGGARAAAIAERLTCFGMRATAVSTQIGHASAIKLCRSVMIKGIEALMVECLAGARHFGVEDDVLASLDETFPGLGWNGALPHYLISRVAEHGRRRAAEMLEAADMLNGAGIEPRMALATAGVQQATVDAMARLGLGYDPDTVFRWPALIDALAAPH
ncbi:NAD(P)-dependent oxidoreductase [Burkholderia cenocepacia]|nr:NAD(P)-dependent oxidoreductase [Burkholderia cenocepacia]